MFKNHYFRGHEVVCIISRRDRKPSLECGQPELILLLLSPPVDRPNVGQGQSAKPRRLLGLEAGCLSVTPALSPE